MIESEREYQETLSRIEEIFDANPGSAEGDELERLLRLVEAYESIMYPVAPPPTDSETA